MSETRRPFAIWPIAVMLITFGLTELFQSLVAGLVGVLAGAGLMLRLRHGVHLGLFFGIVELLSVLEARLLPRLVGRLPALAPLAGEASAPSGDPGDDVIRLLALLTMMVVLLSRDVAEAYNLRNPTRLRSVTLGAVLGWGIGGLVLRASAGA